MKTSRSKSIRTRVASDRGEATRQRLLEVAIRVFSSHGFDGARTRDIAEAARTNVVSIAYYFGNKEGLFRAAASHVASRLAADQAPLVRRARESMARPGITRQEVVEVLCRLICDFLRLILGDPLPEYYGRFVGQMSSGPAHSFYVVTRALAPLRVTVAEAVGILTGESPASQITQVRALSILGSCVFFRRDRPTVLHALGWKQIGAREIGVIEHGLRANLKAMFS